MNERTLEARALVDHFTLAAQPAARRAALAQWSLSVDATPEAEREAAEAQLALARLYADPATFAEARRLDGATAEIEDSLLAREVHLLHLATTAYRRDPETLERIVALETELESIYSNYRAEVGGERFTENRVHDVLRNSSDLQLRRAVWEGAKGIGPLVAPKVLELARLRNRAARALGYRDWFAMSLATDELDEAWLLATLDEVDRASVPAFGAEKAAIDSEASSRLGVAPHELMPWCYQDVFFQEAPTTERTSIEPILKERDIVAIASAFYDDLGLGDDTRAILSRSDMLPRERKTQHAFCTDIDREGDVRVICNVAPTERWLETTLHELGHGVYDLGIDRALPFGLRAPAHTFATEAIAMLMGRRTRDPEFLQRYLGPRSEEERASDRALLRRRMLMLARWVLVVTRFERALYARAGTSGEGVAPPRVIAELGATWWDLCERGQLLRRPPGERPTDWATKLHVALAPVYYQNYLLGELCASQIEHAIGRATGRPLTGNPDAATFLRERWFRPGASKRWDRLVEDATGAPLTPAAFVSDFVAA